MFICKHILCTKTLFSMRCLKIIRSKTSKNVYFSSAAIYKNALSILVIVNKNRTDGFVLFSPSVWENLER